MATSEEARAYWTAQGLDPDAGKGVLFRWGVRIVDVNGTKYLQDITYEEYRQQIISDTGKDPGAEELRDGYCSIYGTGPNCANNGCSSCTLVVTPLTYCRCNP